MCGQDVDMNDKDFPSYKKMSPQQASSRCNCM